MLVRLRGSPSPNMGRVEVYYAGKWGSVYDSGWDIRDATVVCRQLGYTTALLTGRRLFCSTTLPVFFRNFGCYGNESALEHCAWDFFGYTWSRSYCANVMCSNGTADSGEYQFCTLDKHLRTRKLNGNQLLLPCRAYILLHWFRSLNDYVVTLHMERDVSNTCC